MNILDRNRDGRKWREQPRKRRSSSSSPFAPSDYQQLTTDRFRSRPPPPRLTYFQSLRHHLCRKILILQLLIRNVLSRLDLCKWLRLSAAQPSPRSRVKNSSDRLVPGSCGSAGLPGRSRPTFSDG